MSDHYPVKPRYYRFILIIKEKAAKSGGSQQNDFIELFFLSATIPPMQ